MTAFSVTARRENGSLVVIPEGELDIATVDAVRAEAARREPDEGLVVDLRGVRFLDTSGIAFTIDVYRASQGDGGYALRILRAPPRVQRVFDLAGLEGVLPFEDGAGG